MHQLPQIRSDAPPAPAGPPTSPSQRLVQALKQAKRRSWLELTWQFPQERDCLAGFLALEAAEVLAGCKPANLLRIGNRDQPCGRNLYRLWQRYGAELLADSPLEVRCCRENPTELLLLIYHPQLLQRRLASRTARTFLRRCGYADSAPEAMLDELLRRFTQQAIPHEIGLFIGYPLKDVAGFIGANDAAFTCHRGWMIFGKAHRSLSLADTYQASRERMCRRLQNTFQPEALLGNPAAISGRTAT